MISFGFTARQKDKALGSITEVVQTLKHPKSHSRTMSHDTSGNLDYLLPKSLEFDTITDTTPSRLAPSDVSQSSTIIQDAAKKTRKSSRISLMGLVTSTFQYVLCLPCLSKLAFYMSKHTCPAGSSPSL